MSSDTETNEDFNDLEWPVTLGECVILVTGYILVLIGTGCTAAWVLAQIGNAVFKQ